MREKFGAEPGEKIPDLKTPEGFAKAVIQKLSPEEIARISVEDIA